MVSIVNLIEFTSYLHEITSFGSLCSYPYSQHPIRFIYTLILSRAWVSSYYLSSFAGLVWRQHHYVRLWIFILHLYRPTVSYRLIESTQCSVVNHMRLALQHWCQRSYLNYYGISWVHFGPTLHHFKNQIEAGTHSKGLEQLLGQCFHVRPLRWSSSTAILHYWPNFGFTTRSSSTSIISHQTLGLFRYWKVISAGVPTNNCQG